MVRLIFSWDVIGQNLCSGSVRVDEWAEGQHYHDSPFRTTQMPVEVKKGSSSMKNIPAYITEELRKEISSTMTIYFDGVCQQDSTHKWIGLTEDS